MRSNFHQPDDRRSPGVGGQLHLSATPFHPVPGRARLRDVRSACCHACSPTRRCADHGAQEMRCGQCGGRPVVDDVLEVSVYPDLPRVQARRGRPPRWLVEQRRLGNDNTAS